MKPSNQTKCLLLWPSHRKVHKVKCKCMISQQGYLGDECQWIFNKFHSPSCFLRINKFISMRITAGSCGTGAFCNTTIFSQVVQWVHKFFGRCKWVPPNAKQSFISWNYQMFCLYELKYVSIKIIFKFIENFWICFII